MAHPKTTSKQVKELLQKPVSYFEVSKPPEELNRFLGVRFHNSMVRGIRNRVVIIKI